MIVFTVDKGLNGILSALFVSYTQKIYPEKVIVTDIKYQPSFDEKLCRIESVTGSERVRNALINYAGQSCISRLGVCLLSSDDGAYTTAYFYAKKILDARRDVAPLLTDPVVFKFDDLCRKVLLEKHRMTGFLRFNETRKKVLYACYSPDNDITELIAPHFFARFGKIPFVIHDLNRNRIAISDGRDVRYGYTNARATLDLSEDEKNFQNLWKHYFNDVNIKERKNTRQQDGYMPRRYRKFMPETYED